MKYLIILIAILTTSLSLSVKRCSKLSDDRDRLSANQDALLSDIEFYHTKDSIHVASVQVLNLKVNELEREKSELAEVCEQLGIKVRRLESVAKVAQEHRLKFDAMSTGVPTYIFKSDYVDFRGDAENNILKVDMVVYDTIRHVLHRVPRRFLGIPYGTKCVRMEAYSSNPNVRISWAEIVKINR